MSVVKHFIEDSIKKTEIDEFLQNEFERAGYGGVSITKTPLGTHLVIYTMRPGIVIGRGGETIRALATVLEENFQLPSPQISVAEIEIPELNAYVVASRIASALKRGVHYRRAGFWGLNQIMDAGAMGAEIIISGKLRTDRARYEKFRTGYLPKSGEPPRKYMRKAELHVQLKPGILGVKVRLIPPDAEFPDQVKVQIIEEELEKEPEGEIVEEKAVTEEKAVEPAAPTEEKVVAEEPVSASKVTPAKEKIESAEKVAEKMVPPAEDKKVTKKKVAKAEAPAAEQKAVKDKKAAKKKTPSAKKKPKDKKKAEPKVAKPTAPAKAKAASEKKAVKAKAKPVKKKPVAKKKVKAQVAKPAASAKKEKVAKKKVSSAKEKVVPKKKAAEPKVTPAKKKQKTSKKKVAKAKAPLAKEKKEAEE
jgi:small subunit ribosomal protein S3